jgi:hypothetical protein
VFAGLIPVSPLGGIPPSSAFWELKADQVLNRVFEAETAIEVEVLDQLTSPTPEDTAPDPATPSARPPATPTAASAQPTSSPPPPAPAAAAAHPGAGTRIGAPMAWLGSERGLILAGIGITALFAAGGTLGVVGLWSQSQDSLREERKLLLLERLRSYGPVAATPAGGSAGAAAATAPGVTDGLPPPPPTEPWMQELASLPSSGEPTPQPIRVPVSGRITTAAPPAAAGSGSPAAASTPRVSGGSGVAYPPLLVGVVQVPGRGGSAIFQVGNSSTTVGLGESIGSSGWRLVSAAGDSALIERGGEQRRLSIISGF